MKDQINEQNNDNRVMLTGEEFDEIMKSFMDEIGENVDISEIKIVKNKKQKIEKSKKNVSENLVENLFENENSVSGIDMDKSVPKSSEQSSASVPKVKIQGKSVFEENQSQGKLNKKLDKLSTSVKDLVELMRLQKLEQNKQRGDMLKLLKAVNVERNNRIKANDGYFMHLENMAKAINEERNKRTINEDTVQKSLQHIKQLLTQHKPPSVEYMDEEIHEEDIPLPQSNQRKNYFHGSVPTGQNFNDPHGHTFGFKDHNNFEPQQDIPRTYSNFAQQNSHPAQNQRQHKQQQFHSFGKKPLKEFRANFARIEKIDMDTPDKIERLCQSVQRYSELSLLAKVQQSLAYEVTKGIPNSVMHNLDQLLIALQKRFINPQAVIAAETQLEQFQIDTNRSLSYNLTSFLDKVVSFNQRCHLNNQLAHEWGTSRAIKFILQKIAPINNGFVGDFIIAWRIRKK